MLTQQTICVGDPYFVHLSSPNVAFPNNDHRRNWEKGWVTAIDTEACTLTVTIREKEASSYDPANLFSSQSVSPIISELQSFGECEEG